MGGEIVSLNSKMATVAVECDNNLKKKLCTTFIRKPYRFIKMLFEFSLTKYWNRSILILNVIIHLYIVCFTALFKPCSTPNYLKKKLYFLKLKMFLCAYQNFKILCPPEAEFLNFGHFSSKIVHCPTSDVGRLF